MMCSVVFFCRFAAKIWICKCFIIVRFYSITYITSIVKHDTLLFCFLLFLQTLPHTDRKRVKNHTQRKYCWQMKTQRDKLADILYIRVTDSKPETYKYIPRKARSNTIVIFLRLPNVSSARCVYVYRFVNQGGVTERDQKTLTKTVQDPRLYGRLQK